MSTFEEQTEKIFISFVKYFIVFIFGAGFGYFWAIKVYSTIGG